jgi:hypothetical protein
MLTMKNQTQVKRLPLQKRCRKGHRLTGDNIYYRPDGYPACRECMLEADKRYREKQQEVIGGK